MSPSCPTPERLAAAASGEDTDATTHAMSCPHCARVVDEHRQLIVLVRGVKAPPLSTSRRDELAAEIMARADEPARSTRARWLLGAAALVAATCTALMFVPDDVAVTTVELDPRTSSPDVEMHARLATAEIAPPVPRREIVKLSDGELSIDATDREPVTVIVGDTSIVIRARAKVVARAGVIVTAHVFAGTVEIESAGHRQVILAGDVWTRETEPVRGDSLGAFRTGWEALRAGQYAEAATAFDRATDEVVAEDAAFWAAIATERAGDRQGAAQRLRAFLERFPGSPRADAARSALDRVTP